MRVMIILGFVLIAGCGGGGDGGGGAGIDPRLARIDIYESQRLRVLGEPGAGVMGMVETPDISMPDTGTASFTGAMTVRLETDPGVTTLAGDAVINMDFGLNTVEGTAENFFGTDPDGVLQDYAGTVTFDEGSIGAELPNDWQAGYTGVLTAAAQTIVLDGTVDGSFLGDPIAAIAGAELVAQVVYDGNLVDGIVTVIGESTVVPQ